MSAGSAMNDDEIQRRKDLTFEQAEGLAPLPTQLARTEVSQELRAVLWKYIHEQIDKTAGSGGFGYYLGKPWDHILKEVHVYRELKLIDDFSTGLKPALAGVRHLRARVLRGYLWLVTVRASNSSVAGIR